MVDVGFIESLANSPQDWVLFGYIAYEVRRGRIHRLMEDHETVQKYLIKMAENSDGIDHEQIANELEKE